MKTLAISSTHNDTQSKKKSTKGILAILRNSTLTLAVGASLALGSLGFAAPASAEPNQTNSGNAALCAGLRTIYVGNISIANDPKYSAKERMEAKETAARAAADFNKYCGRKSARMSAVATSPDFGVLPLDTAPAEGESSQPVGPISFETYSPRESRLDVR